MSIDPAFEDESRKVTGLATILSRCIVPIFRIYERQPQLCGSGFLVSSGSASFLISAAHVFDELRYVELFFYIGPTAVQKLAGEIRLTKGFDGKNRREDRLDVGVLKFASCHTPPYPGVDKHALPIETISKRALPRHGKEYLLVGFPETQSTANTFKREITSTVYSFRNVSAKTETYQKCRADTESHIVINFDRKKVLGADGTTRAFPKPDGMSGSPIWLYEEGNGIAPSQMAVVGIAIEHWETERAIVSTDIGIALKLINEAF